jgi:hypothetical protein
MKRFFCSLAIAFLLVAVFSSQAAQADSREHHAAVKLCKKKYRDAVRGAKYLKGHQRRLRVEQARRERAECEKLAPR